MKIRGNTVGTPMRPDKAMLEAFEVMTEEQKERMRDNIGAASAKTIGDIEAALDHIIAIQEALIGDGVIEEGVMYRCLSCGTMNPETGAKVICSNCGYVIVDDGGDGT